MIVKIHDVAGVLIAHGSRMINGPAILVFGIVLRTTSPTIHKASKTTALLQSSAREEIYLQGSRMVGPV